MVVAAIALRGAIDDDDGGDGVDDGELVLVCAADLVDACHELGSGIEVRSEPAATTAAAIDDGSLPDDVDAWITSTAWVEVVDSRTPERPRRRSAPRHLPGRGRDRARPLRRHRGPVRGRRRVAMPRRQRRQRLGRPRVRRSAVGRAEGGAHRPRLGHRSQRPGVGDRRLLRRHGLRRQRLRRRVRRLARHPRRAVRRPAIQTRPSPWPPERAPTRPPVRCGRRPTRSKNAACRSSPLRPTCAPRS